MGRREIKPLSKLADAEVRSSVVTVKAMVKTVAGRNIEAERRELSRLDDVIRHEHVKRGD